MRERTKEKLGERTALAAAYGLMVLGENGYAISPKFKAIFSQNMKENCLNLDFANIKAGAKRLYDLLVLSVIELAGEIPEADLLPLLEIGCNWFCEMLNSAGHPGDALRKQLVALTPADWEK